MTAKTIAEFLSRMRHHGFNVPEVAIRLRDSGDVVAHFRAEIGESNLRVYCDDYMIRAAEVEFDEWIARALEKFERETKRYVTP